MAMSDNELIDTILQAVAPALPKGAFFLDFNSASPGAKCRAAEIVNAAGGRYVEGAVMTSVPPYRSKVPLLLGGPDAVALAPSALSGLKCSAWELSANPNMSSPSSPATF